ncbi:hypothetical protein BKA66DRAFT_153333 [Pyrenochaeta sp. MPI-SDFR-AT-0127]|nr:hypothetical protein BKA66DRAFT_153333 [Pyrenochaeta sp. MPI-SDFR-AT-0127]
MPDLTCIAGHSTASPARRPGKSSLPRRRAPSTSWHTLEDRNPRDPHGPPAKWPHLPENLLLIKTRPRLKWPSEPSECECDYLLPKCSQLLPGSPEAASQAAILQVNASSCQREAAFSRPLFFGTLTAAIWLGSALVKGITCHKIGNSLNRVADRSFLTRLEDLQAPSTLLPASLEGRCLCNLGASPTTPPARLGPKSNPSVREHLGGAGVPNTRLEVGADRFHKMGQRHLFRDLHSRDGALLPLCFQIALLILTEQSLSTLLHKRHF